MTIVRRIAGLRGRELPLVVPSAYPIVIAIAYVGLLFIGIGVSIFSASRVFVVAGVGAAVIGIVCNLFMRDRHRGGLLALTLVLIVILGTRLQVVAVLGLVIALLIVERLAAARRGSTIRWPLVSRLLNALAAVFFLTFVIAGFQGGGFGRIAQDINPVRAEVAAHASTTDRPDIYVILLDGYARPDKMEQLFGFDDSPFIDGLRQRGFDISSRSRSNYLLTTLSIPSLLNMRHINEMYPATPTGNDAAYRTVVRSFVSDSEVVRRMRGLGYRINAVSGGFEEVVLRGADRLIDTGQLNEYEFLMMRETAVGPLLNVLAPDYFADEQRARTVEVLEATADVARGPHDQPEFTFVHVPSPHGPIVFGPSGEPIPAPPLDRFYEDTAHGLGLSREAFGHRYVGQVEYLNGRVLTAVDAILAASPEPPVIILMSDHGSGSGLNWNDLAHSDLDERSANLFAASVPGHPHLFPDDLTLVNAFGIFFEGYFGVDVPRQPNTIYRWDDANTHLIVAPELETISPSGLVGARHGT